MIGEERAADRKRRLDEEPTTLPPAKRQVMNNRQTLVIPSDPLGPEAKENHEPSKLERNDCHTTDKWAKNPELYEDVFGLNDIFDRLKPMNRTLIAAG